MTLPDPPPGVQAPPLGGLRVYLDSLGCAKNLVDSEATLGLLRAAGCETGAEPAEADVLVVNTCGFLELAREEAIERILELAQLKGTARPRLLAVLGCLVARAPAELQESIPEVDVWLPAGRHGELVGALRQAWDGRQAEGRRRAADRSGSGRAPITAFAGFGERELLTPAHTAYLKIAEGCSNPCTFCSIPLMRGTQRSRTPDAIVEEAAGLARRGVRELHLVAQDLTQYGHDLRPRRDLLDLVGELAAVTGIEWIRLLYAHPAHLGKRLLEGLFMVPKVVPYLDLPVQHAAPRLLRAMRRGHGPERLRRQVTWLRGHVPDMTLRSTVIVGFPGETERDFEQLCRFVQELRFERLGVFTYSREPGTTAYGLPGRPRSTTAMRRLHQLTDLQMEIAAQHSAARVGSRTRILVDALLGEGDDELPPIARGTVALGRSPAEALDIDGVVYLEPPPAGQPPLQPGQFVAAAIVAADVHDLRARPEFAARPLGSG